MNDSLTVREKKVFGADSVWLETPVELEFLGVRL